jgi:hypothetical protein
MWCLNLGRGAAWWLAPLISNESGEGMSRHFAYLVVLAAVACAGGPAPAGVPSPAEVPNAGSAVPGAPGKAAAPAISPEALSKDLYVFASDSFKGRETGEPSGVKAAEFIAARLAAAGVEPAGDSGYFQRVPLTRTVVGSNSKISVTRGGVSTDIPIGADGLVAVQTLGQGAPLPKLDAHGEVIFVGYALASDGRNDLAGLDVKDKIVVYVHGAPASADSARRAELSSATALGQRLGPLLLRQPAAVVVMTTGELAEQFSQLADQLGSNALKLGAATTGEQPRPLPMVLLGVAGKGSPLLPDGWPADDTSRAMGETLQAHVEVEQQPALSYNVVGIVRGSDAAANHTYVALGAHLDHIGIQPPVDGDSIANGADDDGSGSMSMLAIAEAWTRMPVKPKRSALFVWHTGEEEGLLGSQWFTTHPTVPIDSIVAQLNADMIGRNGADSLYIVGPAAAPNGQSRVLGAIIDSVNASLTQPFTFNREWDSPDHPEHIYYRSDHYNYAQHGIPIVFFTTGLHDDYHKVSDSPDKIDYEKMAHVARLIMRSGVAVANRPTRPLPARGAATP